MPLIPKISKGAVDSQLTYFFIDDTTGVYNVTTNPGGYGTPNPARSALALFLYGFKYVADSDDTAIVINNTADPTTVTQWQIPMTVDGWSYYTMLVIQDLLTIVGAGNTVNGNIYYYGGAYYYALAVTNGNPSTEPSNFQLITDMTAASILTVPNVQYATANIMITYGGKQCLQTQMFKEASENCNCDDNNRAEVRPYQKIFSMLYVAGVLCAQQKYPQADEELVALSEYCTSIGCPSC